ncbi:MAG TPA: hypothetical protein VEJ63_01465 [Planctomycetota bacterium]|nr:hypothetical protein [Planctomycetota bacterium]
MEAFEDKMRRGGSAAIAEASQFFMRNDPVHRTLRKIAEKLNKLQVPYAVAGGMALVAHGYDRTTVDVDILVAPAGLESIHRQLVGLGYLPPFTGSKHLRDTEHGVKIEFLVAGQFPGDGKPKPVAFPDPATLAFEKDGIRYVPLPTLCELKLASGMTNAGRLKDLADVQELIRALMLPREFADQLNPYVREKFVELWAAVSNDTSDQ